MLTAVTPASPRKRTPVQSLDVLQFVPELQVAVSILSWAQGIDMKGSSGSGLWPS